MTKANVIRNDIVHQNSSLLRFAHMLKKDLIKNKYIYIMALPLIAYYIIFHYLPMYGVIISFKEYSVTKGIHGSEWIGFDHFIRFFNSLYFVRVMKNTFLISIYSLLCGFPAPIILALLLNEVRQNPIKRLVQTISYLPHFISVIVIAGMIIQFTGVNGIVNHFLMIFGYDGIPLLLKPELFRTIYIGTNIWQEVGWGSIIYISALAAIDQEMYEAAFIDGAGRLRQLIHITLPSLMPTIIIMLIMRIGHMMNIGYEKILLLYNSMTMETADVVSTYVFRSGIESMNFDYGAAVGLFNSVINFVLLISANYISRKFNDVSLW